jgi:hypothetical protein
MSTLGVEVWMNINDLLWNTDLRLSLGPAVAIAALFYAANGASTSWASLHQPPATLGKNVALMAGFRALIIGTAVACIALGWLLQIEALVIVAAIIGLGELFETSVDLYALRESERWQAKRGASSRAPETPRR